MWKMYECFICLYSEYYATVWICHINCIHPLVNEHLGSSHIWAIVDNSARNIHVHFFLWTYFSRYLGVEVLAYVITPCPTFWGTDKLFSKLVALLYILISNIWEFLIFLILCQHLLLSAFLILGIPVGVKWYAIEVLMCIFLMTADTEHLLLWLLDVLITSLDKYPLKVRCPFLNWVIIFW